MRKETEKEIRKRVKQVLIDSFNRGLQEGIATMSAIVLKDIVDGRPLEEIKEKCEREIRRKA